ncbi:MAG: hypothetical protein QOE30_2760, partial [Mycobacterium sp.]|uniref:MMPL family transporter n=1 Tax=Mycobacterium sp. TaxID=1785 RepID=UPI0028B3AE2D
MTGTISTQKTQRTFFARTIRKFSLLVVLAWIALVVVINVIVPQLEPVTKANQRPLVPLDAPSAKALIQVGEVFKESDSNSLVMVVLEGTDKLDETDHAFYDELVAKLQHDKHVQYVMNLWGEGTTAAGVQSNDGKASYTMVRVAGNQGSTQSNESIDAVRDLISHNKTPPGLNVYVSGSAPLSADMVEAGNKSMFKIMFVTIVLITTMLLIVYRSITTALLVLFMVMMELSCGRGIVSFLVFHKFIGTSVYSSNLLVSLILGAGTDYAIFLIGRYHEARHAGEDRETAYYSAVSGVSHVILGSGVAVAGATFCLKFTRLNYFSTCGIPCAVGLLTAVTAALTFGPALLALGSRVGIFDPKRPAGVGIWRKVGTLVVRWPGRLLLASCVVVLVGSVTLPTYRPNYDDRIYIADDIPSKQGYAASDRHFPVSRLNSDMLLVESDHDMRNSTDMIALDRVARSIFHTPGVGMVQSVTRPLGTPLEHSSFTYTMGTMGTKIKELLPFLTDLNNRLTDMATITQRMTGLLRHQQELTSQQAGATHIAAEAAQGMKDVTDALRDNIADFDDFWRPLRGYFYWDKHCFDVPICWSLRSLFDATDKIDQLDDQIDKNLQAALIQDAVTPQLVQLIGDNADQLDQMHQIILTEHSTIQPQLTQLD